MQVGGSGPPGGVKGVIFATQREEQDLESNYKGQTYNSYHENTPNRDRHIDSYGDKAETGASRKATLGNLGSNRPFGVHVTASPASKENAFKYLLAIHAKSGSQGARSTVGLQQPSTPSPHDEKLDPVELYHRAVRTGSLCWSSHTPALTTYTHIEQLASSTRSYPVGRSLQDDADERFLLTVTMCISYHKPKAFIQLLVTPTNEQEHAGFRDSMTLAGAVAVAFPALTSILLRLPSDGALHEPPSAVRTTSHCAKPNEAANMYAAHISSQSGIDNEPASGLDVGSAEMYDCVQIVLEQELLQLVGDLLPFEYEELLGKLLCRCKETILPKALPVPQSNSQFGSASRSGGAQARISPDYFLHWGGMDELVKAANQALGVCSFAPVDYDSLSTTGSLKYSTSSRSSSSSSTIGGPKAYRERLRNTHTLVERIGTSPSSSSSSSFGWRGRSYSSTSDQYSTKSGHVKVSDLLALTLSDTASQAIMSSVYEYNDIAQLIGERAQGDNVPFEDHDGLYNLVVVGSEVRSQDKGATIGDPAADALRRRAALTAQQVKVDERKIEEELSHRILLSSSYVNNLVHISSVHNRTTANDLGSDGRPANGIEPTELIMHPFKDSEGSGRAKLRSILSTTWNLPSTWSKEFLARGLALDSPDPASKGWGEYETTLWQEWLKRPDPFEATGEAAFEAEKQSHSSGDSKTDRVSMSPGGAGGWQRVEDSYQSGVRNYRAAQTTANTLSNTATEKNFDYASDVGSVNSDLRAQQRLLYMREELVYRRWQLALRYNSLLRSSSYGPGLMDSPLVYMFGRRVSLLSSKLAQAMHKGKGSGDGGGASEYPLLVSMLTDHHAIGAHRASNAILGLKNNLITANRITAAQLAALLASPERAGVAIIQIDVILRVIALAKPVYIEVSSSGNVESNPFDCDETGRALEEMVAAIIHVCERCLIEMPSAPRLESSLTTMWSSNRREPHRGKVKECTTKLMQSYRSTYELAYSATSSGGTNGCAASAVGLLTKATQRLLATDSTAKIRELPWSPSNQASTTCTDNLLVEIRTPEIVTAATTSSLGVSLYTLLHFGPEPSLKRQLLQLAVDLPFGLPQVIR